MEEIRSGERAVCISNGALPKHLSQIFSIIMLTFFLYYYAKYNMQTPEQTEIAHMFSCREMSEGYELVLYDKENAEVFSAVYLKKPEILSAADDILEISVSTGNPSRYVFYFNNQNTKISETFFNPILIDNKYVAYMEDDRLILTDIFREGTLYEEIERNFSEMANSISAVISIELLENGDILLQYYKGENMQIVTEKIKRAEPGQVMAQEK